MKSSSTTGTMAQKFTDLRVNDSPILRRASTTEAVLAVMLDENGQVMPCLSIPEDEEPEMSFSSLASSFDFHAIKNAMQHRLEEPSEKETQNEREAILADARGQQSHVEKNARIILKDDEKFRQFKQVIKQTGMLTANGVKHVLLSPTVDERRSPTPTNSCVHHSYTHSRITDTP